MSFEYRHWGEDPDKASVEVSADRKSWASIARSGESREAEWHTARHDIGPWQEGQLHLRFTVPAQTVSPRCPLFHDGFRLLQGEREIWRGDARENWAPWYNTGFSIWKRASRKCYAGIGIRSAGRKSVRLVNLKNAPRAPAQGTMARTILWFP